MRKESKFVLIINLLKIIRYVLLPQGKRFVGQKRRKFFVPLTTAAKIIPVAAGLYNNKSSSKSNNRRSS
jgi:hypothetical protein